VLESVLLVVDTEDETEVENIEDESELVVEELELKLELTGQQTGVRALVLI
jgi:hypothetical protein